MVTLTFLGATRQVTGSRYLIETDSTRVLLECGMFQGSSNVEALNAQAFPFDPTTIDAVILSHAHIDHSGLLPKLVRDGFNGPIFMTPGSHDLVELMLKDAAHIQHKDTDWENRRRRRAGKQAIAPLFDIKDVEQVLEWRHALDYNDKAAVSDDIKLRFSDAGHILGSAIVEIWVRRKGSEAKLVFSGDLGNQHTALLRDPETIASADVLLLESTYGDRNHRPVEETQRELEQALTAAAHKKGNVLIPSFTVGRTQEILYYIGKLYQEEKLQQKLVFLDSPMGISANHIYLDHMHQFNNEEALEFRAVAKGKWENWLPILRYTRSTAESMQINSITGGAIIIAGSGMCSGGRIMHHLKYNLWRANTHLIIVGYQAHGTLGRALVEGAKMVTLLGNDVVVKAQIHTLGGFSAHADQDQLLRWAGAFQDPRPQLFLVHGELDKMLPLQKKFHEQYNWYANIPAPEDSISL